MICRLNTVNLSHHPARSSRHSLHCSQGLLWRNLAGHVIIIGGILAVTLAGGGGCFNCRATVLKWRSAKRHAAERSRGLNFAALPDPSCEPLHVFCLDSLVYFLSLLLLIWSLCQWKELEEESGKEDGKCVCLCTMASLGFKVFPGVSEPILWKGDDVHSPEGERRPVFIAGVRRIAAVMKAAPQPRSSCPCWCLFNPAPLPEKMLLCVSLLMCL